MICEHCGYQNSEYAITCDKCGKPLSIEKNLVLQKKYNHKPMAIDIERITPDMEEIKFKNTKQTVKYTISFILGALFVSLIVLIVYLIKNSNSNDILNKLDRTIENNNNVIVYVGKDSDIDKKITDYSKKYEFEYIYIPSNKLTITKSKSLKKKLNIDSISSSIVYIENKETKEYEEDIDIDNLDEVLSNYGVISLISGDPSELKTKFDNAMNSQDAVIMYIANNSNKTNEEHNKKIETFCDNYSLNYVYIEGYILSENQKLRLLKRLNYNEIHDELLVIMDEGNIKNVSEFVDNDMKDYYELISSYGIIDQSSANQLKEISYKQMQNIISKKDKSVILINSLDCTYCERTKPILGKISIQNDIVIYSYTFNKKEQANLEKYLNKLGYNDDKISTPLVIISENEKISDYIIGLSSKKIYEEKFKEYGIIR